jgi:hypothetical protein
MCTVDAISIVRDLSDGISVPSGDSKCPSMSDYGTSRCVEQKDCSRTCLADVDLGMGMKCVLVKHLWHFQK